MGRARRRAEARGRARGDGGRGDGRRVDRAHRARDARPGAAAAGDGVRAHLNAEGVPTSAFRVILRSMRHGYLHVPFCVRRCSYCDFSIAVRKRIPAREYVDAVLQELRFLGRTDPGREPGDAEAGLETIYFGGGTPSLLPPGAAAELL